jgi:hypothetical protein
MIMFYVWFEFTTANIISYVYSWVVNVNVKGKAAMIALFIYFKHFRLITLFTILFFKSKSWYYYVL